jgi:chromosome segregation ATPase
MNNRDAYVQKMKAKLDEWNADLDKLSAKADAAEADAKLQYNKQIEGLRKQRDEARQKLEELASASDDAWDDVRQGVKSAWEKMSDAFSAALGRFK